MLGKLAVGVACVLLAVSVRPARASTDVDDDDWRPDVLRCEEAVAKLVDCCPRFDAAAVDCTYEKIESTSGCDFTTTTRVMPSLDEDESACVVAASCAVLIATGVCDRGAAARAYVTVDQDSIDAPPGAYAPSAHPPVCP